MRTLTPSTFKGNANTKKGELIPDDVGMVLELEASGTAKRLVRKHNKIG